MAAAKQGGFQQTLIGLLHNASVEITPRGPDIIDRLRDMYDPGTEVFISFLRGTSWQRTAEAAAALRREGFVPVPHIAARNFRDLAELDAFLARLRDDAAVDKVLVIAGDMDRPRGPFGSALDLLDTGRFEASGIRHVGLAGYPEGHPRIADGELATALADKIACLRAAGLAPFVTTQFCFSAEPILAWLAASRKQRVDVPVRIGVAGPASVATLVRFAVRCGIGNSLRTVQTRTNMIGRLLGDAGPDDLLRELATELARHPDTRVEGIHFFPFGGLAKTSDWISAALTRLYAQITSQSA